MISMIKMDEAQVKIAMQVGYRDLLTILQREEVEKEQGIEMVHQLNAFWEYFTVDAYPQQLEHLHNTGQEWVGTHG